MFSHLIKFLHIGDHFSQLTYLFLKNPSHLFIVHLIDETNLSVCLNFPMISWTEVIYTLITKFSSLNPKNLKKKP